MPKVVESFKFVPGSQRNGILSTLNASARNCSFSFSAIAVFFTSDASQLVMPGLRTSGSVRPTIDAVFRLEEARAAFERVAARGKRGKVVLNVYATE